LSASLVLRYLRAIDEKVDRVAGDVREIKTRVGLGRCRGQAAASG